MTWILERLDSPVIEDDEVAAMPREVPGLQPITARRQGWRWGSSCDQSRCLAQPPRLTCQWTAVEFSRRQSQIAKVGARLWMAFVVIIRAAWMTTASSVARSAVVVRAERMALCRVPYPRTLQRL